MFHIEIFLPTTFYLLDLLLIVNKFNESQKDFVIDC